MKIKNLITKESLHKIKKSLIETAKKQAQRLKAYLKEKVKDWKISRGTSGYRLLPLYPTIEKKHHAQYVSSLNRATKDHKIKNLALTGHYGSGKSSILEWFIKNKRRKVVQISFSTLGANIEKYITTNDEDSKDKRLNVLANLIQKEIVKHILFNDKPSRLPNSRYKRAAKPDKPSTFLLSLLITAVLSIIAFVMGLTTFFEVLSLHTEWITIYLWATGVVCTWFSIAAVLFLVGSKIKLDKVSGGPFSLSLSGEKSYFDEYLDEIIYYFQATGRRIVVIEDIDRFNTLYIFENLRQLNTIINNSKQIRGRVLFVYAIKDSVFVQNTFDDSIEDTKGVDTKVNAELAEAQGGDSSSRVTNRTKFFDLIIPVVPFITISTSSTFIKKMLDGVTHNVSDGLIESIAKHIIDMRLIKNIYNEFVVFKDKVLADSEIISLNDNGLFALVAYKNMYLEDFEKIKDGNSVLDEVYEAQRAFVRQQSRRATEELGDLSNRLVSNDKAVQRAIGYGEVLLKYVDGVAAQTETTVSSYTFDGKAYTADEIKGLAFWEEVSKADLTAVFTVLHSAPAYGGIVRQQTFTKAYIAQELIGGLDFVALKASDEEEIKGRMAVLQEEQKDILHQGTAELMFIYNSFTSTVERIINKGLTDPKMALDLLSSGFIDSYYILYTSVYHKDGMKPGAANFAIQFIHRTDQQDMFYQLDNDDIKQLLSENSSYVDERSMYNISIVDYLVTRSINTPMVRRPAKIVLGNIGRGMYNAEEFIDEYVTKSKYLFEFIARVTPYWSKVFGYLVKSELIKSKERGALIGVAIVNTNGRMAYVVDEEIAQYIVEHVSDITALMTTTEQDKVDSIKYILKRLNTRFTSLSGLGSKVKQVVIDNDLYTVNAENLKSILGNEDYSLDAIKAANTKLYENILSHFKEYTAMLDGLAQKQYSIKGDVGFEEIINDVSTEASDGLGGLLDRANTPNCIVEDIHSLKAGAWTKAVEYSIVTNTLTNVMTYYDYGHSEGDPVDEILGEYLNKADSVVLDQPFASYDIEKVESLMVAILNSVHVTESVKVAIVKACFDESYLGLDNINEQEGSLYGDLLKNDSIEDTAENLNAISGLGWGTRKQYITNSSAILRYMDEVEWKVDDIGGIASSDDLDAIKRHVIDDTVAYKDLMNYESASEFIEYAYAQNMQLTPETLSVLFSKGGRFRDEATIGLVNLIPSDTLTIAGIIQPLGKLPEPYSLLTQHLKKPKLDNEPYNVHLVERMRQLGMVSSSREVDKGRKLQVNMKASW